MQIGSIAIAALCLMPSISSAASLHLDIETRLKKEHPVYQFICRTIAIKLDEKEVFAMRLWGNPCPVLRVMLRISYEISKKYQSPENRGNHRTIICCR